AAELAAKSADDVLSSSLHTGKQGKHQPGHPNFKAGASELTADPTALLSRVGTGTPVGKVPRGEAGFKEIIDVGDDVGYWVNGSQRLATQRVTAHYAADGSVHFVPAHPRG